MLLTLRNMLATNRLVQKVSALTIAFFCWSHLTIVQQQTITINVPLCFYNVENTLLEATETISLILRGKKGDLTRLDYTALAVHVDASQLQTGKNGIIITNKDLFLPDMISVVNYNPMPLIVIKKTL